MKDHRDLFMPAVAALALALALGAAAEADDRNLIRTSSSQPYVYILFDNTFSMTTDLRGDRSSRFDDGTDSKIYLAKEALNQVLEDTRGVSFGFATFPNFSRLRAIQKSCGGQCIGGAFSGRSDTNTNSVWCTGWEGGNDDSADAFSGYRVTWPTTTNPSGLSTSDAVPLDWNDNNVERIRERLAPNLALGESTPDFGVARYFRDAPSSGETFLRLRNELARPFFAWGNTPLQGALDSFRVWYDAWLDRARIEDAELAAGCRSTFVVLLTDGFETCGGNPVTAATTLLNNYGVKTFVIGFAVNNPALHAIATAGGTDSDPDDPTVAAYPADDQQALIDAFNDIIQNIQAQSRTFASAAVPSVSASAEKQIYLTSFSPVSSVSVWPGRLDAYNKPVPFTTRADGKRVPNRALRCSGPNDSGCRVWSADEELVSQAPNAADVAGQNYRLGNGVDQRRVFYALRETGSGVPAGRRLFSPPADPAERLDLYGPDGMGLSPASPSFAADGAAVIGQTLVRKQTTIEDPLTLQPTPITYVLGDIFHSDPLLVGSPDNFRYFSADMPGRLEPCGPRVDGKPEERPPYTCFALSHRWRRRVLLAGSNDGQLHAIDAGQPVKSVDPAGNVKVEFTPGRGRELFSFVPRSVLGTVRRVAQGGSQEFSVDGTVTIDDVVIDPVHAGVPDPDDRQWRTVVVAGLREGGRGYYALDVTQPDRLDPDGVPRSPTYVPSCIDGGAGCKVDPPISGIGPFKPLSYPLVLWELADTWDEDGNGAADMGFTWSRPDVGRIRVLENGTRVEKYVAVLGGGLDPDFKRRPVDGSGQPRPRSGNYLYMVDIETGRVLYKRRLDLVDGLTWPAMVPARPAAVDTDFDSFIDTIYVGTTAGHLFKVDVSEPQPIETVLVDDFSTPDPATGLPPLRRQAERVIATEWEPFPVFSTGGRPIYFAPSVVFVSELSRFALAFGTGDREDLWSETRQEGRFYLFLDGGFTPATPNLPFDESKLEILRPTSKTRSDNLLLDIGFDPAQDESRNPGWAMRLGLEERVIAKSFSLSGVVFFNSYVPEAVVPQQDSCGQAGQSHIFAVAATNANGIFSNASGDSVRLKVVADFVTNPFVEVDATDDEAPEDPSRPPASGDNPCAGLEGVTQSLRDTLFSPSCRFANYTVNVKTLRSDSGMECIAPVPLCVVERNWKEF